MRCSNAHVWVIVGASQGLGAALVQRILDRDSTVVFACARDPGGSDLLPQLAASNEARLHLIKLDVTDETSVQV